jgi:hypothetical protein
VEQLLKADAWRRLKPSQKARRCRLMAEEAIALSNDAAPEARVSYLLIAESWLQLAENIEWAEHRVG